MNRAVPGLATAREPSLLRREAKDGREPCREALEQRVQHRERRAALQAGIGFAIKRVLADIEVGRRKIVRAELRDGAIGALEVEVPIGFAHLAHDFGQTRCRTQRSSSGMSASATSSSGS